MTRWILPLLLSVSAHAGDFAIGGGKLLNNVGSVQATDAIGQKPWHGDGYLVDLAYRVNHLQFTVTATGDSSLGRELNVSAIYRRELGRWHVGGGVIVSHTYRIPDWWFTSDAAKYGYGTHFGCQFCGLVAQGGVQITDRLEFQVRYWATQYFITPRHNGALVVVSWRL